MVVVCFSYLSMSCVLVRCMWLRSVLVVVVYLHELFCHGWCL